MPDKEAKFGEEGITPGKWSVITSRDVYSAVIAEGIATVCMDVANDHDARLITASKDLLAACQQAIEAIRENLAMWCYKDEKILYAAFETMQAAVAKALEPTV